jgi:hypothetical protein
MISADGNVVVFRSGDPGVQLTADTPIGSDGSPGLHLYARNRSAGTTVLVDANGPSFTNDREIITPASLSSDGRYVAFDCWCQREASGPNAGMYHVGIYRTDLTTRQTIEVDANENGVVANGDSNYRAAITGDGASILFGSLGTNLVANDDNNHADIFISTPH